MTSHPQQHQPSLAAITARLRSAADITDTAMGSEHADRQHLLEALLAEVRTAVAHLAHSIGDTGSLPVITPDEAHAAATRAITTHPQAVADRYAAKYQRGIVGDRTPAHRNMVVAALIESAATVLDTDAELVAAVRAVVQADQAEDAAGLAALREVAPIEIPDLDDIHPFNAAEDDKGKTS